MVKIQHLTKRYGGKEVVSDVSCSIGRGQITSFIGPNGAGKSTLLGMISRLIPIDAGTITIDGRDIDQYKTDELSKKISILRQTNHLNLKLTVRELVSFGRFPYSQGRLTREDWEHVDRAIASMELDAIQHKHIDKLSGGQRQSAFIAMVVAQDTDYILLDEPLNNLDMKHSVRIMKLLRKLVDEQGKSVVIVIHDVNFAASYSDYLIGLKGGRIIHEGETNCMICPLRLHDIFDMEIRVEEIDNRKLCLYFS